jgi:hypothetical protein
MRPAMRISTTTAQAGAMFARLTAAARSILDSALRQDTAASQDRIR